MKHNSSLHYTNFLQRISWSYTHVYKHRMKWSSSSVDDSESNKVKPLCHGLEEQLFADPDLNCAPGGEVAKPMTSIEMAGNLELNKVHELILQPFQSSKLKAQKGWHFGGGNRPLIPQHYLHSFTTNYYKIAEQIRSFKRRLIAQFVIWSRHKWTHLREDFKRLCTSHRQMGYNLFLKWTIYMALYAHMNKPFMRILYRKGFHCMNPLAL